jgi:hypothetical protein
LSKRRASTNGSKVKATARCFAVAMVICSWIAISNHCAFGAVAAKPEAIESECPFHSKPAKQKETSPKIQCCKVLRAVVANMAKTWACDQASFSDVDLTVEQFVVFAEAHNTAPLLLDTGPPGKTSFAELIGSVRPHAPPISA